MQGSVQFGIRLCQSSSGALPHGCGRQEAFRRSGKPDCPMASSCSALGRPRNAPADACQRRRHRRSARRVYHEQGRPGRAAGRAREAARTGGRVGRGGARRGALFPPLGQRGLRLAQLRLDHRLLALGRPARGRGGRSRARRGSAPGTSAGPHGLHLQEAGGQLRELKGMRLWRPAAHGGAGRPRRDRRFPAAREMVLTPGPQRWRCS
jgi:hypothetical protein